MRVETVHRCRASLLSGLALLLAAGPLRAEAAGEKKAEGAEKKEAALQAEYMNGPKAETGDFNLNDPEQVEKLRHLLEENKVLSIGIEKPPDFLKLHWDLGLWSLVVFLGLMFILSKVAWKPMLEGLQNRENRIRKALDDAEQARKETADLRSKLQAEMDSANAKVRQMIEEGRRDAQRVADETLARAKAEIQGERDRGRREIETARDQALKEIWDRAAGLATQVSSRAIGRELNAGDHRRLVDEALAELKQQSNGRGA